MLTILGVINGKEDESFFDAGNVTVPRWQMIATVLNQGADVERPVCQDEHRPDH